MHSIWEENNAKSLESQGFQEWRLERDICVRK